MLQLVADLAKEWKTKGKHPQLKKYLAISQNHVMLHNMARGESGRIVLEIDPSQKDDLYYALRKDGLTLKDWFLQQATQYLSDRGQMPQYGVSAVSEESPPYTGKSKPAPVPGPKAKISRAKDKSK